MIIYSGSVFNNGSALYYNGVHQANTCGLGNVSTTLGSTVKFSGYGSPYNFNGLIDDVRIYNRSLSAAEILAAYNAGK